METSITSDPIAYRAELERSITYNYEAYKKHDQTRDERGRLKDELTETFERRFNNSLMGLHDLLGFVAVEHETTD